MSRLDEQFEHDMIETVYRTAGRETGYWAAYFLRAVKRHGGVAAAKRMLGTKGLSKGLATLGARGRLDLAMETLVLKPEYRTLFTEDERAIAARRLAQVASPASPGATVGSIRGAGEP
jgi:5-methylcytosine-specific restriction protein A